MSAPALQAPRNQASNAAFSDLSFSIGGKNYTADAKGVKDAVVTLKQDLSDVSIGASMEVFDSYLKPNAQIAKQNNPILSSHVQVIIPSQLYPFQYSSEVFVTADPAFANQTVSVPKDSITTQNGKSFAKNDILTEYEKGLMVYADGSTTKFYRAPFLIPRGLELGLAA